MDRSNFFDTQVVLSSDLTGLEDAIEAALGRMGVDHLALLKGVLSGMAVTLGSGFNLNVSAGIAYDATTGKPQRIAIPSNQFLNLGTDLSGVSVVPTTVGQSRKVLFCVKFLRFDSNSRTQADGSSSPYTSREGFSLFVVNGTATAGTPAYPAVGSDAVILAGATVAYGDIAFTALDASPRQEGYWQDASAAGVGLPLGIKDAILALSGATLGNLQVTATGVGFQIRVNQGFANFGDKAARLTLRQFMTLTQPSAGQYNTALVYLDSNGVAQVVYGTASGVTYPAAPSHTIGVPLAEVQLRGTGLPSPSAVLAGDILDVRGFVGRSAVQQARQRTVTTATASQTVFDLPWKYTVGNHSLNVFDNGVLVDEADYTETDTDTVTFAVGRTVSHKITFEADIPVGTLAATPHAASHLPGGGDPIDFATALLGFTGMRSENLHVHVDDVTTNDLLIGPFSCVINGVALRTIAETSIATAGLPAIIEGGGAPVPGAFYFLYAYNNGGAVGFHLSTTPPNSGNVFKTGDSGKLYLAAIPAGPGNKLHPLDRRGRTTRYIGRNIAAGAPVLFSASADGLSVGTGFGYAGLGPSANGFADLSSLVPVTTRQALVTAFVLNAPTVATSVGTPVSDTDTSSSWSNLAWTSNAAGTIARFEVVTDSNRRILAVGSYSGGAGAGANTAICVDGFRD
jgi:hypothetical protein